MDKFGMKIITLMVCYIGSINACGRNNIDESAPSITCPADIHQNAERGQTYAIVTWDTPVAIDDTDGIVHLDDKNRQYQGILLLQTLHHGSLINREYRYGQGPDTAFSGSEQVCYGARDSRGNYNYCCFWVHVYVVQCGPPERIDNGYFTYSPGADWRYGGRTRYSCQRGYVLEGHSTITCELGPGNSGEWSAAAPSCQKRSCSALGEIERASLSCSDSSYFGSECTYTCEPGYDVASGVARTRVCNSWGIWLGAEPTCLDVEKPAWIGCPSSLIAYTDSGSDEATPTWTPPGAVDNSADNVTIELIEGFEPGTPAPGGMYGITYSATDSSGNSARPCSFMVNVRKITCPRIYPSASLAVTCPDGYDWGVACSFACPDSGYDLVGVANATCQAPGAPPRAQWSFEQTMPYCQGRTCPDLPDPDSGALSCDTWINGYFCGMACNGSYSVPASAWVAAGSSLFVCSIDTGVWSHVVPDCSGQGHVPRYLMDVETEYFSANCSCNDTDRTVLQQRFSDVLTHQISGQTELASSCANDNECRVEDVMVLCAQNYSEDTNSSDENCSFLLSGTLSIAAIEGEVGLAGYYRAADVLNGVAHALQQQNALDLGVEDMATAVNWFEYSRAFIGCEAGYTANEDGQCVGCEPGLYYDAGTGACEACPRGTYGRPGADPACLQCPEGQSTARAGAEAAEECEAACRPGTYSVSGVGVCSPCVQGTYSDAHASLSCTECPDGLSTQSFGATSVADCQGFSIVVAAPLGSTSYASLTTPISSNGTVAISFKVHVETVNGTGAILTAQAGGDIRFILSDDRLLTIQVLGCTIETMEQIILVENNWNTIYLAVDNSESTPSVLYINKYAVNITQDCQAEGFALFSNVSIIFGQSVDDYVFGGKFTDVNLWGGELSTAAIESLHNHCAAAGAGGLVTWTSFKDAELIGAFFQVPSDCDVQDDCVEQPCGVHACVDAVSAFECVCHEGFTGVLCETDLDDCLVHACEEGATCLDAAHGYTCTCPPNTWGQYCQLQIVHGGYSEWSEWSDCDVSCGGGTMIRQRTCTQPEPGEEGRDCQGANSQSQACNTDECPVCEELSPPEHGYLDCHVDVHDYRNCTLQCGAGYDFSVPPLPYYLCDANTTFYQWNFQTGAYPQGQVPDCTEISALSDFASEHTVSYVDLTCSDVNLEEHERTVQENIDSVQCVQSGRCSWDINIHPCDHTTPLSFSLNMRINPDLIPHDILGIDIIAEYEPLVNELIEAATFVRDLIDNGTFTVFTEDDEFYVEGQDLEPVVICPGEGMTYFSFYCVACERGTYGSQDECFSCERGSYQDDTGQTDCKPCPDGFTTQYIGSRSIHECSVELPITDESNNRSPSAGQLGLAIGLPLGLVAMAGIAGLVFMLFRKKMRKGQPSKTSETGPKAYENNAYVADEEDIKYQGNKAPPVGHTVTFPRPTTAPSSDTTAHPHDVNPSHFRLPTQEELVAMQSRPGTSRLSSRPGTSRRLSRPGTARGITLNLDMESGNFGEQGTPHRSSLVRQPSSVSQIRVQAENGSTPTVLARPDSARSTGLAFKPDSDLPFIHG